MKRLRLIAREGQAVRGGRRRPEAGQDVYVAIDLSRRKWVYGLRWGREFQRRLSSPAGLEHVKALVEEYRGCQLHVVYEACGFGYEIAWWLEAQGVEVMVIAPCRVERPPGPRVKTDRIDVREMACKLEHEQLKAIFIARRAEHQRRQLSRTYAQAMKECKRARVRLRSLMQEQGLLGPEPRLGWAAYQRWLLAQELAAPVVEHDEAEMGGQVRVGEVELADRRHRERGRPFSPDLLRNARQLVSGRLLQARGDCLVL